MKIPIPLFCLFLFGCEVLEPDLSGKHVVLVAPADGVTVPAGRVRFCWTALPGADGYEFTLVAPSFAQAVRVLADTVLLADSLDRRFGYERMLSEGEYAWSLRAFNSAYTSRTRIRHLTVTAPTDPDGSGQQPESAELRIPDASRP